MSKTNSLAKQYSMGSWTIFPDGQLHTLKLYDRLRENGVDMLEQSPDDGNTALHWLVRNASKIPALELEILEAYLNNTPAGCSPQNFKQDTPLHTAILSSQTSMAVVLIKAGADLNLRDTLGRTPLDLAMELGRDEVVTAIQKSLADTAEGQPQTHDTYEKVINKSIQSILGTSHETLVMAALEIASYAMRPLTITEFEHVLGEVVQGRGLEPVPSDSVSAYFDKTRDRWFPSGQANMALACLRVLVFHDLPEDPDTDWASKSLYKYAACEWGRHLRAYSPKHAVVEDLALRYLAEPERLEVGIRIAFLQQAYGFEVYDSDFEYGLGALHVCSLLGLTNSIRRLMADVVPQSHINSQTHDHKTTLLMYAASMGHLDTVELLLELGADPYLTNAEGRTALYEALRHGSQDVVMFLLSSPTIRPDAYVLGNTVYTALMRIESFTSIELIRALLSRHDVDINECDERQQTVLSHVLMNSSSSMSEFRVDVAKLILDKPGFKLDAVDDTGRSHVQQLLESANFDEQSLQLLLDKKIDIEHRDYAGESAIFYAICWQPSTRAARMLLERGANIRTKNFSGDGLMHCVVKYYSESRALPPVRTLLSLDRDLVDSQDKQGRTALHKALSLAEVELVWNILEFKPDVDILDSFGRNALEVACQYGCVTYDDQATTFASAFDRLDDLLSSLTGTRPSFGKRLPGWSLAYLDQFDEILKRLEEGNLDMLEPSPDDGKTALHWLMRSKSGTLDIQKQILGHFFLTSVERSPRDYDGCAPLHMAITENSVEMAELLIQNGANPYAKDNSGRTPLDLAMTLERTEIIAAIETALFTQAEERPQIVIEVPDHDTSTDLRLSPVSLQDLIPHASVSVADRELLKNRIVSWLTEFADLYPPNVSSTLLDTEEYQRLLGSTNFTSWCTGSSPRRIDSSGVPVLSCFVSRNTLNITRHEEAGNILANLLGQLVAYGPAEAISAELTQLYNGHKFSGTRPSDSAVVRLLRNLMQSYPKIFLVMDAHSWNDETIQVWRSITDLCPENLSILVATTDYQQPTPGIHCDHCGNLTAKYWHCAICDGEGVCICSVCKSRGLACLDASHDLAHFDASKDQVIVDVVSRRLI
ncbi:hypothetical protein E4T48_05059 [Aureobasidium sp. EXF-10727]|nr:hypothetical protein E4T48_05059 [Aureobasidium sp. EXF-10727]